jgi:hypothetical protein
VSTKTKTVLWALLAVVIGMLSVNMYINVSRHVSVHENRTPEKRTYLQREEINGAIDQLTQEDRLDEVIQMYTLVTGDESLARTIVRYALHYEIPVSLLFSIISVESEFNPKSVSGNYNGSYDYGLMSLNSKTFRKYSAQQLLNIDTNLKLGCEFLLWLKKRYGTWGEAVIHYNGLYTKGAGTYMVKVMEKERTLERMFNEQL